MYNPILLRIAAPTFLPKPDGVGRVEDGVGRGRVVQLAFALGAGATDFPKKKAFVPFIHGLARYLAGTAAERRPAAGETGAALPVGELLAAAPDGAELIDPDGTTVNLAPGAAPPLAERPGIHRLKRRVLGRTETSFVAVNAPAAESDLRTAGEGAFLAVLGTGRPATAAARARLPGEEDEGARSSLWAIVLGLVAGMLLLESMLANRVLLGAQSCPKKNPHCTVGICLLTLRSSACLG